MNPESKKSVRLFTALSMGLSFLVAGCGLSSVDDGDTDAETDGAIGADEAALYNGWSRGPREQVHVWDHPWPGHYCGDGVVGTNEECDDGDHGVGDGCNTNCRIEPGFTCQGSPSACADVDECHATTAACGNQATCRNLIGSFECACNAGFDGNGMTCSDVDECALGLDACDDNAQCRNKLGGYGCACNTGYEGDGFTCADIDECAGTSPCAVGSVCANHDGGFKCACDVGFEGADGDCSDIDECSNGTAECSLDAKCNNRPGTYECVCAEGFKGDGFNCEYIGAKE
jgi:cysteine-rich repeat protein